VHRFSSVRSEMFVAPKGKQNAAAPEKRHNVPLLRSFKKDMGPITTNISLLTELDPAHGP
jgi:hypothetical protein